MALQPLLDNIYSTADTGKLTLLVSLDLSAAFDTMLSCSSAYTPVSASQALYIPGYNPTWPAGLSPGRTQSVKIGNHSSPVIPSLVGVPQGSVLGPLLFSIYTSPISTIAQSQLDSQQQYTDDTQLYLALSPTNHNQSISALQSCLNSLHTWFCDCLLYTSDAADE